MCAPVRRRTVGASSSRPTAGSSVLYDARTAPTKLSSDGTRANSDNASNYAVNSDGAPEKEDRPMGEIRKRGGVYWVRYYRHGRRHEESTHSDKYESARDLLRTREGD